MRRWRKGLPNEKWQHNETADTALNKKKTLCTQGKNSMCRENTSLRTGGGGLLRTYSPLEIDAPARFRFTLSRYRNSQQKAQTVQRPTQNAMAVINSYTAQVNSTVRPKRPYLSAASSWNSRLMGRRVDRPRSRITAARARPSGPCSSCITRAKGHLPRGPSFCTSTTSSTAGSRSGRPRGDLFQQRRARRYSEFHRQTRWSQTRRRCRQALLMGVWFREGQSTPDMLVTPNNR